MRANNNITALLKNLLALVGLHPVRPVGGVPLEQLNPLAYPAWRVGQAPPPRRSARQASSAAAAAAATAASATRI